MSFVNVSCANLYRNPTYHSEIDSQVTLWENVELITKENDFLKIIAEDGYEGWLSQYQCSDAQNPPAEQFRQVTVSQIPLYDAPERDAAVTGEAVAGSRLPVRTERPGWAGAFLPGGREVWVPDRAFHPMPLRNRENLVRFARSYLGIPYFWGGKTPKGFDCSGFVQLVFKLFSVGLRRDAWMQHESAIPVSGDFTGAQPGDLFFFAENGTRVTHVGIAMGRGLIIHAKGQVRINSLEEGHTIFDPALRRTFVDVRTYF